MPDYQYDVKITKDRLAVLIGKKGRAGAGMDAQSATHFAIIVLVILCNGFYLSIRASRGKADPR